VYFEFLDLVRTDAHEFCRCECEVMIVIIMNMFFKRLITYDEEFTNIVWDNQVWTYRGYHCFHTRTLIREFKRSLKSNTTYSAITLPLF
jgi:hypothetical protein